MSSGAPGNPQRSSIASLGWLFGTKLRRLLGYGVIGGVAVGVGTWGILGMLNQQPLDRHATRFNDGKIQQVTANPPEPAATPPASAPAAPASAQAAPPPVVASPPAVVAPPAAVPANIVRIPKGIGEQAFDIALPVPASVPAGGAENKAAGGPTDRTAATTVAFKGSEIAAGRAGRALRLDYVMLPQSIECALDTAMDSTFAGFIRCHTTHDVESRSHIVLMPAGTIISGSYKNDVRTGQARIFSFAATAYTPEGVPVPLDSQMGDGFGRVGVAGDVNNHYGERFGAAIALTSVQTAAGVLQSAMSKGGNSYFSFNSGGGVQDLASEILRQQGNIPPTITVPPGTIVSVIVDHAISFEDAIRVRTRE